MSIKLLEQWKDDGTFARLDRARDESTRVRIKRSSGEFVEGYIKGCGGLAQVVVWGPNADQAWWNVGGDCVELPEGALGKVVRTADLIEWNPWLGAAKE